jgi:hypothetical protein
LWFQVFNPFFPFPVVLTDPNIFAEGAPLCRLINDTKTGGGLGTNKVSGTSTSYENYRTRQRQYFQRAHAMFNQLNKYLKKNGRPPILLRSPSAIPLLYEERRIRNDTLSFDARVAEVERRFEAEVAQGWFRWEDLMHEQSVRNMFTGDASPTPWLMCHLVLTGTCHGTGSSATNGVRDLGVRAQNRVAYEASQASSSSSSN